jgi:hypothetical protein
MLEAHDFSAGRDLYCTKPSVTQGFSFCGLIRRTAPFSRLLELQGDAKDLFLPGSQVRIQLPFTTRNGKGILRTYSYLQLTMQDYTKLETYNINHLEERFES